MNNTLPVLIVGAGPAGLMMACELARHNIAFRLIDKKSQHTAGSNATWIQTRTLELLDQIGLATRFLKAGHPCKAINLYVDGKPLSSISLDNIDSTYPYILMLPQSKTEELLIERLQELNGSIEWSSELVDIKQDNNLTYASVRRADGNTEVITSQWLIACDGANSTVREKCHVFFPGEDLKEQFIVADATIDSFNSKNEIHLFFDQGTVFAASPMGANKYRIAANLHLDYPRHTFYDKEVIELVQERAHGAYYVKDVAWVSFFWIHSKIVEKMRHDRIFLVGDAAHIHSPAGGQGMNAGIQDAYNLAWKLALIVKNDANLSLLDSFQLERHPIVSDIVNQTETFTKMALFDKNFLTTLRQFSDRVSQGDEKLNKEICAIMSQTGIQYKNSPIICYENNCRSIYAPGTRMRDVILDKSRRLYDYLQNPNHNVLLFTGTQPLNESLPKFKQLYEWLNQLHPHLIKTHLVTNENIHDIDNCIYDEQLAIHHCYEIEKPTILIIRPDNYIAYRSENLEYIYLERFFQKYLL